MSAPTLSFEVFPPHDAVAEQRLLSGLDALYARCPAFVSVTYGAGGSKRERSRSLVAALPARAPEGLAAHLAAAGNTQAEITALAGAWWGQGLRHRADRCAARHLAVRDLGRRLSGRHQPEGTRHPHRRAPSWST